MTALDVSLPERAQKFLKEYSELCRKHGLMICSDGEQVQIGAVDKDLWGVEESTKDFLIRFPDVIKEIS